MGFSDREHSTDEMETNHKFFKILTIFDYNGRWTVDTTRSSFFNVIKVIFKFKTIL